MGPSVKQSVAVFSVRDVPETLRYYREVLGFPEQWGYGDPPTFGGVLWGSTQVMFSQDLELAPKVAGHGHWFKVDQPDRLYRQHLAAGASVVSPIENKPWGEREYTVRDLNGYLLRFGGPSRAHSTEPVTEKIQVSVSLELPSVPDHARLWQAVGWRELSVETTATALKGSLFGAVARVDGQVVGAVRVVGDGAIQYYIQDLMVLPAYQNRGVGSALMACVLAEIRKGAAPGAWVSLFTTPVLTGYYERLGFRLANGMAIQLDA